MEPLPVPKTIKVYQLIRQSGMNFVSTGSATTGMSAGFYITQAEAEHNRTLETLKDTGIGPAAAKFHVFELEFPNPAYKE